MRALLITPKGIVTIELDPRDMLESMRGHLDCRLIAGAGYPDAHHAAWADDEFLLTLEAKLAEQGEVFACQVQWDPDTTLIGNVLITGFDPLTGDTLPATMSLEELAEMVSPGRFRKHEGTLH